MKKNFKQQKQKLKTKRQTRNRRGVPSKTLAFIQFLNYITLLTELLLNVSGKVFFFDLSPPSGSASCPAVLQAADYVRVSAVCTVVSNN